MAKKETTKKASVKKPVVKKVENVVPSDVEAPVVKETPKVKESSKVVFSRPQRVRRHGNSH